MSRSTTNRRLVLALALLAAAVVLTPSAEAKVRISFGQHGGHHAYHKYRSHYGHHGHHRYRSHHRYRYAAYRHHAIYRHRAYRYARHRYHDRQYISPRYYRGNTARLFATPRAAAQYPILDDTDDTIRRSNDGPNTGTASSLPDGWRLFRDGHYARAFNAFGQAASAHPKEGEPKLGYALAAAMRGDDDRAAFAMRRVRRFEPDVLDRTAPVAAETLQTLIERYEYQDGADARLMLRALKRLQQAGREDAHDEPSPKAEPSENDPY